MANIELSDLLVELRRELLEAKKKAESEDLKFDVENIDIELTTMVTRESQGGGKGKIKFWIFEAEAGGEKKIAEAMTQTIRLQLKPDLGKGKPLQIGDTVDIADVDVVGGSDINADKG